MYKQKVLDSKVKELRKLRAQRDSIEEEIKVIEEELKNHMTQAGVYELNGEDWKITWNLVASNRFSQSNFKKAHPDLYAEFTSLSESRRFLLT